ncbi:MAG: DUF1836 domain-containing protein [Defluviitaleaceae bacterium]|nr:DUF1836 domain-containing protein [Defluviitaleaceae bacterium]
MIHNILKNIGSYNGEMTVSQVIRFFDGFGMHFTKTMIQNYVRIGIIPPPAKKRYYLKKHIILLALIYEFKEIYSLPDIGKLFEAYIESVDDSLLIKLYEDFHGLYDKCYNLTIHKKILPLMVQSVVNKKIVKNMMDNDDL